MWTGVKTKKALRECPQDGWEMLSLEDKDVKAFVINMFRELKETMPKEVEKGMMTMF